MEKGRVRLASFSPRYLGLVDYEAAARGERNAAWRPAGEDVLSYIAEHAETCGLLYDVTADDAVVAVEIDDFRVTGASTLIPLAAMWADLLDAAGFRIAEKITLVRKIAIGRRSGQFKQNYGKAGYFYPDNVTSTLLIAFKGEPMRRLRADSPEGYRLDVAWAERFLKNAWTVAAPQRRFRAGNHPVPQDRDVARAVISFYSLPGDLVLDPYAGSGTTARESLLLGRSAVMVERVAAFAARLRTEFDAKPLAPVVQADRWIPGAQLHLPFGEAARLRAKSAFLEGSRQGTVSTRFAEIARIASDLTGVSIPPELIGVMLRAERAHVAANRVA
jgi:hypothetical protein